MNRENYNQEKKFIEVVVIYLEDKNIQGEIQLKGVQNSLSMLENLLLI